MQKIMRRKSNIPDDKKFDGQGVDFKSKLIGIATVTCPRGDDICQEAISDLKAVAVKNNKEKKEHKQKITINITIKGIRLIDDSTERIDHAHPIHRISFISHDKDDKRTFGYIVGTKEGYKLFALKTTKEAEVITRTLKDLFQEVFKRHQVKKEEIEEEELDVKKEEEKTEAQNEVEDNTKIEAAEDALDSMKERTDSNLLWDELNDQIQEMQQVGMSHSTSFDMLSDPFRRADDVTEQGDGFDDNFSPDQQNFNPFDEIQNESTTNEKVDFFSLPSAEELRKSSNSSSNLFSMEPAQQPTKSTSYSEDLYAIPNPPSRNITNGSRKVVNGSGTVPTEGEPTLMKHDPFDEMKKNINDLHQQNIIQQQQQQQMTFAAAFPNNMTPQIPVQMQQGYTPNNPNPFSGNIDYLSKSLQPSIPSRPVPPPVIPARPSSVTIPPTNPFLNNQQPPNPSRREPDMGWSVLQPTTIKDGPPKPKLSDPVLDPFSFLNEQTTPEVSPTPITAVNGSTANNELLDLFG